MIALLLAAQLGVTLPPTLAAAPEPQIAYVAGERPSAKDIIQQIRPKTLCGLGGRMEAQYSEPTALYRSGDRPAKLFTRFNDYPPPKGCLVADGPGFEKDLWISQRIMPPAEPRPTLEKDLRIGPPGAPSMPRLLLVQTEPQTAKPPATILRSPPPIAERTPNLYKVPEQCKGAPVKVQDRFGRPVAQKLADLPKGALIYAVDRRVDGCPVLVVVYGTPALDNPNPATPSGPEKITPVKREDAPSSKR